MCQPSPKSRGQAILVPLRSAQYKAQPEAGSPVAHTAFHELQQHCALKPQGEELKQSPSCRTYRTDGQGIATQFGDLQHKTQALHL